MPSEWIKHPESKNAVKNLLIQAGLPLEIEAANICRKFVTDLKKVHKELFGSSEKLVYSPPESEETYREIDQLVTIYEEFKINELTGIQLIVYMPIECKYREDIELFGFPVTSPSKIHEGFPIYGNLTGSVLSRTLLETYRDLSNLSPRDIVLVEIKGGKTPGKVQKEELLYKAGAALYDYVLFDLASVGIDENESSLLFSLLRAFDAYLKEKHYLFWDVLRQWIERIDEKNCDEFNKTYFEGKPIHQSITANLPIIYVNGPLYSVKLNEELGIDDFEEVAYFMTSIRKSAWPGKYRRYILNWNAETPIIITNSKGLNQILDLAYKWQVRIKSQLLAASSEVKKRWALEARFYRAVYAKYEAQLSEGYRSDFYTFKAL